MTMPSTVFVKALLGYPKGRSSSSSSDNSATCLASWNFCKPALAGPLRRSGPERTAVSDL
jgi:hypothetical protein